MDGVVAALVDVYRVFDRRRRQELKEMLEVVYDRLKDLGVRLGVSGFSVPRLSDC